MEYWAREYLRIINEDKENKEKYLKSQKDSANKKLLVCRKMMKIFAVASGIAFFINFYLFMALLSIAMIAWIIESIVE